MAIGNHNDLTHIVRTSDQWKNTYDKYELIPTGVLCVELVSSDVTKIKIGDGHNIFSKLPYIGDLDLSKYYTKLETDTRIKEILTQEKVVRIKGLIGSKSDLPADARCGDIYFVRQLSSSDNKYIEYIYSPDNTWEPLGGIPVDIDLSEYAKTAYVDDKIEQVNERIDDIEQHGTHTHPNKEILDQITEPYTTADKETLASLHNYDDTEIREMISQSSHTHANKDILDATSAAFTKEDKSKLDQLNPYDDSILKEKIQALERLAHEHSNKRILDQTTASFTKEYERKMRWIRMYTGCTGMEEGIAGLVPAAQAGEEDYVLSGSGEWVPQTGGGGTYTLPIATASTLGGIKVGNGLEIDANGVLSTTGGGGSGDSIAEGEGITITTDSQTGVKTIGVNVGDGLDIDPLTNELFVNGQLPEGTIIKKLTYVGNGEANNIIQFTKKPLGIITLYGQAVNNKCSAVPTVIDADVLMSLYGTGSTSQSDRGGTVCCAMSYDDSTNELTLSKGLDAGARYNISGETYQMYYLTKGHTGSGTSETNEVSVVKTFSYTGTGTTVNNIQFPETPDMILKISGSLATGDITTAPIEINHPTTNADYMTIYTQHNGGSNTTNVGYGTFSFNDSTNVLTLTGGDYGDALNYSGGTYYVQYIVNEVIPSTMPYDAGEAISIETIGGLQPTNYSNDDFVDSIASINAGSIVKAADKSSFTLTASINDCYTRGSSGQANGSYPFNVKASTKYRFAWDSANPTVHGKVYTYENGLYDAMMHEIDQYDSSYLEFTTSANTTFIQARFGVMYAGDSITYSNVRLYEVIETEDEYDEISVKYNKGLSVNQNNELEVNIGSGLAFDPQTGAINVTGGGGGSGDTVAEGDGISITTDQQTGDKVIAINPGTGLQVNQTTNELEVSSGVVTSIAPTQNTPGSITVTEGDGTTTPVSVISQMGGATSSTAGTAGYVPAPASGDDDAYLRGDGTWDDSVVTEDDELTLVFVPDDYQPS